MSKLLNSLVVSFMKAIGRIPFKVLYRISDFLYVILFYVVCYRKKVVYTNLRNSFPEKEEKEIDQIARRYYHHLCDLFLESAKLYWMTDKDLDERLIVTGLEKVEEYYKQGKSYILIGMHYNNWEWCSTMQRLCSHQVVIVFNPIRDSKEMDRYLLDSRERFGSKTVSMAQTARVALKYSKTGRPTCLFLAADQTPPKRAHFWTTFLNQETPFFSGPEHIAIKTNQPVFLLYCRKIERGKYEADLIELFPEPNKVKPDDILMAYVDRMEQIIREKPEYWLWSHRRWKHKRPEGVELIPRKKN